MDSILGVLARTKFIGATVEQEGLARLRRAKGQLLLLCPGSLATALAAVACAQLALAGAA